MVERPVIVSRSKLGGVQFQPDMFRPTDREIRMIVGVVADLVPLGDDPPNEIGIFLRIHSDEEKCRLDAVRLQDVEDARGPFRIGPVVKGERDLMFSARALVIEGGEFREIADTSRSNSRRLRPQSCARRRSAFRRRSRFRPRRHR